MSPCFERKRFFEPFERAAREHPGTPMTASAAKQNKVMTGISIPVKIKIMEGLRCRRILPILPLLFWAVASPGAQEPDLTPWVLVVPPANTTGDRSLDSVGDTVAETIEIALRQLGDFELRELPNAQIPPEVFRKVMR